MPTKDYPLDVMAQARLIVLGSRMTDQSPHPYNNRFIVAQKAKLAEIFQPLGDSPKPVSREQFLAAMPDYLKTRRVLRRALDRGQVVKAASVRARALEMAANADPPVPKRAVMAVWRDWYRPAKLQTGRHAKRATKYNLAWAVVCVGALVQFRGLTVNAAAVTVARDLGLKVGRPWHIVQAYTAALSAPESPYGPALNWLADYADRCGIDDEALHFFQEQAIVHLYDTDLEMPLTPPPLSR